MILFCIIVLVSLVWSLIGVIIDKKHQNIRLMKSSTLWFLMMGPVSWAITIYLLIKWAVTGEYV